MISSIKIIIMFYSVQQRSIWRKKNMFVEIHSTTWKIKRKSVFIEIFCANGDINSEFYEKL